MEIKKILVANRGEIARRVIKSAKKLGKKVVAVYSEADKDLPFVSEADESVNIGEPHPLKSYLDISKIIEAAKKTGADAIHPGYGFLSEREDFVKACEDNNITFIGPTAKSMEIMGDKATARRFVRSINIPIPPGTEIIDDVEVLKIEARKLGYPVLLKAAAGGGGIGMVRVEKEDELSKAYEQARSRAKSAFGDERVYMEKYLQSPHHIEIQVLGDGKGGITTFPERECSVQRRHQKVIEESPSTFVDEELRKKIRDFARKIMSELKYRNAGTVEFVVDRDKNIYFLEVNTRLQVEHPITEAITGFDLVEWQIKIAEGENLPDERDIRINGWGIECRIYAEDPVTFLPSPGKITELVEPKCTKFFWDSENIRLDIGYIGGNSITPFYDPLIAKLVARGNNRSEAIQNMLQALSDIKIEGIKTNIKFLLEAVSSDLFKNGGYDTHFIQNLRKK
ncbi:MAG: ATP-grasp domain-containing protein [Candidatus Calescibacterium sp.]|nr:ATP-grasp domain-containing protein [Candidatus Calescibacterium sp.]MCX7734149.1 ATP-grasp domain-containing protein [bacterium]MDW8087858.1 biotin carboxylase N-terminal domain-containing protein [Candidatus Calescibacterium sp.]